MVLEPYLGWVRSVNLWLKHGVWNTDLTLVWTCGTGNYGWWITKILGIQNNYRRDLRTNRSVSARDFQNFVSPGPVRGFWNFACPGSVRSLKIGPDSIRFEIQIFAGPSRVRPWIGSGPWIPERVDNSEIGWIQVSRRSKVSPDLTAHTIFTMNLNSRDLKKF